MSSSDWVVIGKTKLHHVAGPVSARTTQSAKNGRTISRRREVWEAPTTALHYWRTRDIDAFFCIVHLKGGWTPQNHRLREDTKSTLSTTPLGLMTALSTRNENRREKKTVIARSR